MYVLSTSKMQTLNGVHTMQKLSGINVLTNYISLGAPVKSTYLAVAWLDLKIAHTQNMLSHIAYIYTMLNLGVNNALKV